MAVVGVLEIQMAADLARLSSDINKAKRSVSDAVGTMNRILGSIGVGVSFVGITSAIIKATTDLQRFNQSLIVATGSAEAAAKEMAFVRSEADRLGLDLRETADQYAKLAAAAKGTALEGKATRDIFTAIAQASTVMGLSADQAGGALLAIQQIISKGTVSAEELRGQLGERLPGAFQIAARSIGVTTQELDKLLKTGSLTAEQLLPALAFELNNTFGPQAEQAAQGLNAQINRFNTAMFDLKIAIGELGLIEMFTAAVNAGTTLANVFASSIIPKVKEFAEFINSIPGVSTIISAAFGGGTSVLIKKFSDETKVASDAVQSIAKNAELVDKKQFFVPLTRSSAESSKALREAAKAEREMQRETERLEKDIHNLTLEYDPLYKLNTELAKLVALRGKGLRDDIFDSAAASKINEYIAALGGVETAVKEIEVSQQNLGYQTQEIFSSMEQIAIQGARNIQSAFADGLFRVFDDGLKGMVNGVKNAVGRMIAEFASIRLLQGTGLAGLFGMSGAAAASTGGGIGALDLASLGSGALSLFNSGFGLTGALSSVGGMLPGAAGAFFSGVGGGTVAGISSPAALAGSSFGAFAGPAAIAAIADIGLRQLFGDKQLGGTAGDVLSYIPVVGTLINGLFGRGAPKFRQEDLLGSVSSSGFDGVLNQAYRERGGAFRGDRVSNFIVDTNSGNLLNQFGRLSESGNIPGGLRDAVTDPAVKRAMEVGELLDTTFSQLGKSLESTADILGLSKDALNGFNAQIDLVSEKGQAITQEQIGAEIARISDEMITSLIPSIHELGRSGEDSAATLERLGGQFQTLQNAIELFGASTEDATGYLRSLSLEQQTALVDQFGGAERLSAELSDFYNNVFTDSQKLEYTKQRILDILKPLNVDFVPSLDQIYKAVASGNPELVNTGLMIDGLVVEFNRLNDTLSGTQTAVAQTRDLSVVNDAFSALQKSVQAERNRLTEEYNIALRENNEEIQNITQSLSKFNALSSALQQTIESINPIGLNAARSNIRGAINSARSGNVIDLNDVRSSLTALSSQDTSRFGSRLEFLRNQAENANLLRELGGVVDGQADTAEASLKRLEDSNRLLELGFNAEQLRLDAIINNAQQQLDVLNGIKGLLSVSDAQSAFNSAATNASLQYSNSAGSIRSNLPIREIGATPQQIKDFVASQPSPGQVSQFAAANNLTSGTFKAVMGYTQQQIDNYFNETGIPRFAAGSSFVPRTGPAIVHKGERIINPQQNKDLIDTMKSLLTEMRKISGNTQSTKDVLNDLVFGAASMSTRAAS